MSINVGATYRMKSNPYSTVGVLEVTKDEVKYIYLTINKGTYKISKGTFTEHFAPNKPTINQMEVV